MSVKGHGVECIQSGEGYGFVGVPRLQRDNSADGLLIYNLYRLLLTSRFCLYDLNRLCLTDGAKPATLNRQLLTV